MRYALCTSSRATFCLMTARTSGHFRTRVHMLISDFHSAAKPSGNNRNSNSRTFSQESKLIVYTTYNQEGYIQYSD